MGKNDNSQTKQIMIRFKEQSAMHMRVYDAIQQMNYSEYGSRNQMLIAFLDEYLIRSSGGHPVMALPDKEIQELRKGIAEDMKQILGDVFSGFKEIPSDGLVKTSLDQSEDLGVKEENTGLQEKKQEEVAGIDNPEMLESLIGSWND